MVSKQRRSKQGKQRLKPEGFFSTQSKQAKSAFQTLWKRPLGHILTLAVIAMALSVPSCLYLVAKNILAVNASVTYQSQVTAFISEGTPDAKVLVAKDKIETWDEVASVTYITPEQGLVDLSEHSGLEQAVSMLEGYVLPGVLLIQPKDLTAATDSALVEKLSNFPDITDIRRDKDWLGRFDAIKQLALVVGGIFSVLMFLSVVLIVGNTLRFNVLANKESIQTMKLIGATDAYILRPYLYTGMWFGLLGAIVAWALTALVTVLANNAVSELSYLYDSDYRLLGLGWDESLIILMTGLFLGMGAASLSAKRHLKEIEPV
ncbi:permease-like cell division protein FtsX [Vibrio hippocampi]|uniref:Cell division protein FtsX n=1 Tax=Vibrio hippocampi TaxID=654686 RepID=A0ABM8ZKW4_9VIBR|nr:permease-like cell division protein FtsX [Vibrio hippocampi]CAH0527347.1 Cell division protein FtsX [Vibrio hippocampi]